MKLPVPPQPAYAWLRAIAVLAICFSAWQTSVQQLAAHEVDQYTLPDGKEFIDLGDYWNHLLYDAVQGAVDETNFKIRQARRLPQPVGDPLLAHYHSHDTLAWTVRRRLPSALMAIESLEMKLRWKNMTEAPQDKTYGYFSPVTGSVYSHTPLLPDPRQLSRMSLMRCSLVKVHGTYMGTDKIGHFVAMGFVGFNTYRAQIGLGVEPEKALSQTITMADIGPLGESGILGVLPTGIYSNADMAADYLGMKYYRNLMEPVTLHGQTVPPMVTIENDLLVLNPEVRPDGPYFARFISNHFDEVLNPSLYEWGMRDGVRQGVRARSQEILKVYAGDDPRKRNPAYFNKLIKELSTYYGEPYGHSGQIKNLISVGNTCFNEARATDMRAVASVRSRSAGATAVATDRCRQEPDSPSDVWVSSGHVVRSVRATSQARSRSEDSDHQFADYDEPASPDERSLSDRSSSAGNWARASSYSSGGTPSGSKRPGRP